MRTPILAGNWKMNMNPEETAEFVKAVKDQLPASSEVESVIAAPAVDLPALLENAKGSELKVAAENCYFEDKGAFTGETSPKVLKEMGVDYVIIGHLNVVIISTKQMKTSTRRQRQSLPTA